MTTIEEQLERLTLRNKKLATEKSYLQLTISVMNSVAQVENLEEFTEMLPKIIIDAIGGTNVILYYKLEDDFYFCDAFDVKSKCERIDDILVAKVIEEKKPLFTEVEPSETLMNIDEFTEAWIWVYPLVLNNDTIGVLKLENLHIGTEGWHEYIPTLFGYIATQLGSRILSEQQERMQKRVLSSETRFKSLFYQSPISLWEEDFSQVKELLDMRCKRESLSAKELFEHEPQLLIECTKAVKIKCVNDTTITMYKAKDEDDFFAGLSGIFTDESLIVFKEELISLYDYKLPFRAEALQKRLDDTLFWVSINVAISPMFMDSWERVFVSLIDIDEHKKAQQALEQNEKYLNGLMNAQPNIVVVNDGISLIDANKAFFEFFSDYKTLEEFKKYHKCICEFFEQSDRANYLSEWSDGKWWLEIIKEHPETLHKVLMKKNGIPHYFAIKLEFLKLGDETKNIATFTDITALEESNITLEQRVQEELRKRELQEEKMLNQARLAQLGEMLTMISHHWRQPLMAVSLIVQNLQDAYRYNELTQESLDGWVEKVMRILDNLSQTLITLSSLTAKQKERGLFNASEATKKLCELSVAELDTFFIRFYFDIEEGVMIEGVLAFYTQVLANLLKNAQEAVIRQDIRERTIKLSLSRIKDGGIRLIVEDSGNGIKDGDMPRVFDPFFTTKEISVKTGLGLYFVKMIVEQQFGGTIEVQNGSKGAKFTVYFPDCNRGVNYEGV